MLRARCASWGMCWLVAAAGVFSWCLAQPASAGEKPDKPPKQDQADKKAEKADKEKPDFPPFDEVSKDHKQVPAPDGSFWKLYYNKKTDRLLAVIPNGMLKKNFL
ncbi:MAG: hypothetical protein ACYS7M_11535, partial [Planctomycetota bacterium]